MTKRTFWWRGTPNFGDVLAQVLVNKLTRHRAVWSPASQAELVVTGSIATMLPDGWSGVAVGIGWARPEYRDLTRADVRALRGVLSQRIFGRPVDVLGDPGLLAPLLLPGVARTTELLVIPHWQDTELRKRYPGATHVSPRQDPITVIDAIRHAKRVVSSSLHGIIVADAYGIERRWETFDKVQGGGFKFRDHATVVGKFEPDEWGVASEYAVRNARRDLTEAILSI